MTSTSDVTPLLSARGIGKRFGGVHALDSVDLRLCKGEIHALMGENGAGKSTLIKILTGVHPKDEGTMLLEGTQFNPSSPIDAQRKGISTVYQEVNLISELSVAENIALGRQPTRLGCIRWKRVIENAHAVCARLDMHIDVRLPLSHFSIAVRQMVAIARALDFSAKILILDEPTSSLDASEVDRLFETMAKLKKQGMAILFITHFIDQVYRACDRITVLRNGKLAGEFMTDTLLRYRLIATMLGKEINELETTSVPRNETAFSSKPILSLRKIGRKNACEPLDIDLHNGEIVGLAGLLGSGRTETARLMFGIDKADQGSMVLDGKPCRLTSPRQAIAAGFGFCPENRKEAGIIEELTVRDNIILALQAKQGWLKTIPGKTRKEIVDRYIRALSIATPDADQKIKNLSGGNQQKCIIARWLAADPRLLILDEPTRGIDVGAKVEILKLIISLSEKGMSLVFISAELSEVVRCSHRVAVMCDGRKILELCDEEITEQRILETIAHSGPIEKNNL